MPEGGKCTVAIDATEGVARVIFANANNLGIEREKTRVDDVITFENGKAEILIYNGLEKGALTFDISFSGASALSLGASVVAALAYLSF